MTTTLFHVVPPSLPCDLIQEYFLGPKDVEANRRFIRHFPDDLMSRVVSASHISGLGPDYAAGLLAAIGPGQSFIWLDGSCSKHMVLDLVQANILTSRCLRAC